MISTFKRIRIPNEDVPLSKDEVEVTQTRLFQRLFLMKQLGLAYLVYPFATHTRGAHSIRCVLEASKVLKALRDNKHEIDDADERAIRLAALLHDIAHVPFSHTLEDENIVLVPHDDAEQLKAVIEALKREVQMELHALLDEAVAILAAVGSPGAYESTWKSDIVGNTVCADLLAYIVSDPEFSGIEKRAGFYRIYEYFTRHGNRLCIRLTKEGGLRPDIVSCITDLLDMRYALTERILFHHAKCVASAMLARAARLCGLADSGFSRMRLMNMGDEGFLDYLESVAKGDDEGAPGASLSSDASSGTLRLIECIRSRQLYKRIFKVGVNARKTWDGSDIGRFTTRWRKAEDVEKLLVTVEDTHELPRGSLALWCPDDKAGMKLAKAQVVWESGDHLSNPCSLDSEEHVGSRFPVVYSRITNIEQQYQDLWSFWIALDRKAFATPIEETRIPGIVRAIEGEMGGVSCDREFEETYLSRSLRGYSLGRKTADGVQETFRRRLHPRVEGRLLKSAALTGNASQKDEGLILEVTSEAVGEMLRGRKKDHRERKPPQESRDLQQGIIFPEPGKAT